MKLFFVIALLPCCLFLSCAAPGRCRPSPGSRDWSIKRVIPKTDGTTTVLLVRYEAGVQHKKTLIYQCLPDSVKPGRRLTI